MIRHKNPNARYRSSRWVSITGFVGSVNGLWNDHRCQARHSDHLRCGLEQLAPDQIRQDEKDGICRFDGMRENPHVFDVNGGKHHRSVSKLVSALLPMLSQTT